MFFLHYTPQSLKKNVCNFRSCIVTFYTDNVITSLKIPWHWSVKRAWHPKGYTFYIFALSGLMFYLCYLYLFTHTVVQHDYNIRWCSCSLTVTPRVTLLSGCTYILLDIHGQFTFAILHHYKVYSVM